MRLANLKPGDINPLYLVDREETRGRIVDSIDRFLQRKDRRQGQNWTILGDKGVGKSILTRWILNEVSTRHASTVAIVIAECNGRTGWRPVIQEITESLVTELGVLQRQRAPIPDALLDAARAVAELARFDEVEIKRVHDHLIQFKQSLSSSATVELKTVLKVNYQVDLTREERVLKSLTGTIQVDNNRLTQALIALFRDLSLAGLDIVLYLDNVDELRDHRYWSEAERTEVRDDVEGLLRLAAAPIALVVNMRTYYSGVLGRQMTDREVLEPLPFAIRVAVLHERLKQEGEDVRTEARLKDVADGIQQLAREAPTPLSFLEWFYFLAGRDKLTPALLEAGKDLWLRNFHSGLHRPTVRQVVEAFPEPDSEIGREQLLAACGSEGTLRQLEDQQVVLPRDFWSPTLFTLDPSFQVLHPKAGRPA